MPLKEHITSVISNFTSICESKDVPYIFPNLLTQGAHCIQNDYNAMYQ